MGTNKKLPDKTPVAKAMPDESQPEKDIPLQGNP